MSLRLCRIGFHRNTKIQVDDSVRTRTQGQEMILIEIGSIMSFGKDHWVGIVSQQIDNIEPVKKNIEKLEKMKTRDRIEWFKLNCPKASLIKIDSTLMADRMDSERKDIKDVAVTIDSVAPLSWEK